MKIQSPKMSAYHGGRYCNKQSPGMWGHGLSIITNRRSHYHTQSFWVNFYSGNLGLENCFKMHICLVCCQKTTSKCHIQPLYYSCRYLHSDMKEAIGPETILCEKYKIRKGVNSVFSEHCIITERNCSTEKMGNPSCSQCLITLK